MWIWLVKIEMLKRGAMYEAPQQRRSLYLDDPRLFCQCGLVAGRWIRSDLSLKPVARLVSSKLEVRPFASASGQMWGSPDRADYPHVCPLANWFQLDLILDTLD